MISDMAKTGCLIINGHDYTQYVKHKTGITFNRENTNDADAGRDTSETMHPNVTSHQRKLDIKLNAMPFLVAQQLEHDLTDNPDGVKVTYPDLYDGICTRLFYNTSVKAAYLEFHPTDGIKVNDLNFTLTSVKEEVVAG